MKARRKFSASFQQVFSKFEAKKEQKKYRGINPRNSVLYFGRSVVLQYYFTIFFKKNKAAHEGRPVEFTDGFPRFPATC